MDMARQRSVLEASHTTYARCDGTKLSAAMHIEHSSISLLHDSTLDPTEHAYGSCHAGRKSPSANRITSIGSDSHRTFTAESQRDTRDSTSAGCGTEHGSLVELRRNAESRLPTHTHTQKVVASPSYSRDGVHWRDSSGRESGQ